MLLLHLLTMLTFRKLYLYSLTIAVTHIAVRIDCRKKCTKKYDER